MNPLIHNTAKALKDIEQAVFQDDQDNPFARDQKEGFKHLETAVVTLRACLLNKKLTRELSIGIAAHLVRLIADMEG